MPRPIKLQRKMQKNTFTYKIGTSLYINLTNKCPNACVFCIRDLSAGVGGYNLWLEREPTADEVIAEIEAVISSNANGVTTNKPTVSTINEIVFCGYGEPTYRLAEIAKIAAFCRSKNLLTRLNTNGLGSLINGRDISKEVAACIHTVSVSLNAPSAERYRQLCKSEFGTAAFDALIEFGKRCLEHGAEVVFTVVDALTQTETAQCRKIAENLGAKFRVRHL